MLESDPLGESPGATALKLALLYCALGLAWILFSDWLLRDWLPAGGGPLFQTIKGTLYVLVTAAAAYVLLRHELVRKHEAWQSSLESNWKSRVIADSAQDAVVLTDEEGRVKYWNPAAESLFGYTQSEMLGRELHPLVVPPELQRRAREGLAAFRPTGQGPMVGRTLEVTALRRDGAELSVELSVSAAKLNGRWHAVGIVRDIAERKARQRELEEARRRLEAAHRQWLSTVDAIREPLFTYDPEGRVLRCNRAYAELAGVSVDEVHGRFYWELFPRMDGPLPESGRLLDDPLSEEAREDVKLEDGTVYHSRAFAAQGPEGDFRYIVQVLDEVTAQRRAEEALRESRRMFRTMVEHSPAAMLVLDRQGGILFLNSASLALVGASNASELVGRPVRELVVSAQGPALAAAIKEVFDSQEPVTRLEFRVRRLDGGLMDIEVGAVQADFEGGVAALVIVHDVTEHKRAEQAIARERERARQYLDIAGAILVALDRHGRIELINRRGCEVLGYEERELLGKDWIETCIPLGWRDEVRSVAQAVWAGSAEAMAYHENPVLTRAGEQRLVAWRNSVIHDAEGRIAGTLSSGEDITESRKAGRALERRNRALRTLSACNEVLIRASDEQSFLQDVCRVLTEEGGYPLSWVGYAEHGPDRRVHPVARCGEHVDYVDAVEVHWGDDDLGSGPAGMAIRTGTSQKIRSISTDPRFAPWREQAVARGLACVIALPLQGDGAPLGVLNVYSSEPDAFDEEESDLLSELAADLAFGIRGLRNDEERRLIQARHEAAMLQTVQAIARTVEMRDPYTAGHQERVARLAVALAEARGLSDAQTEGIRLGSLIHDIGKIHVPAEILSRPSGLSEVEYGLIKTHPGIGYGIMKDVETPWPLREMILQHHERLDGSGYPQGLKGEDIILEARILAVADVVEAMASHRPYRPAVGVDKALEVIREGRGALFDPQVVDACLELFREARFGFDDVREAGGR